MFAIMIFAMSQFEYLLPFNILSQFSPELKFYTRHSLPFFSIFLYYRFSRIFLDLPKERPELNSWVVRLEYLIITFAVISPLMIAVNVSPAVEDNIFLVVCSIVIVSSGIIIYNFLKRSIPLFRFAMAGAMFLIFGSILMIILSKMEEAGINTRVDPFLPLLICVIAELLTFTTGLSYKTHLMEAEKLNVERKLLEEFREKQRLEKEMYTIRDNIARDLHDDIGSTISNINICSKIALKGRVGKTEQMDDMLNRISLASAGILDSMEEIVWSLRSQNDDFQKLTDRMMNFAHSILTIQEIDVNFNCLEEIRTLKLEMEARRNIYLIFKEAMNNIAKYSNAKCVEVSMFLKDDEFIMSICDDGIGYDIFSSRTGNGERTMKERAQKLGGSVEIISVMERGTRVHFSSKISNIID